MPKYDYSTEHQNDVPSIQNLFPMNLKLSTSYTAISIVAVSVLGACMPSHPDHAEAVEKYITEILPSGSIAMEMRNLTIAEAQATKTNQGVFHYHPFEFEVHHIGDGNVWYSLGNRFIRQYPQSNSFPHPDWIYSRRGVVYKGSGHIGVHEGKVLFNDNGEADIQNLSFSIDLAKTDSKQLMKDLASELRLSKPGTVYKYNYVTMTINTDGTASVQFKSPSEQNQCTGKWEVIETEWSIAIKAICNGKDFWLSEVGNFLWASPDLMPDMDGKGWTTVLNR